MQDISDFIEIDEILPACAKRKTISTALQVHNALHNAALELPVRVVTIRHNLSGLSHGNTQLLT